LFCLPRVKNSVSFCIAGASMLNDSEHSSSARRSCLVEIYDLKTLVLDVWLTGNLICTAVGYPLYEDLANCRSIGV
jgi:hypothetical protein